MRQRNLSIIRAQAARITQTVRQLMNLARIYDLRREPAELAELAREAVEQLEADAARAGVQVEFDAGPGGAVADVDRAYVQQVLLNICSNAIQAMPGGGRMTVAVVGEAAERGGRQFAAVRVSDTGGGIAPEHLSRIFDPFYTTKDVGHGTGLGLSVAHRIVAEHGGWIEAVNNEGAGATFTIYLPLGGRAAGRAAAQLALEER